MTEQLETDLREALANRASQIPAGTAARLHQIDYHPRSRRIRPPIAFGVSLAGAAGTAAVVASVVGLGAGASTAFAGWTATPTSGSDGQTSSADAACEAKLATLRGAASASGLTPVLTDTRGPFTFVIFTGTGTTESCITSPSFTSLSASTTSAGGSSRSAATSGSITGAGGPGSGTAMTSGTPDSGPVAAGAVALDTEITSSQAGQAYTFVEGRTGSDVTGTTLVLADGTQVTASVSNGWFAAWWPGTQQATQADVTTASGTTTQALHPSASGPGGVGGMGGMGSPTGGSGVGVSSSARHGSGRATVGTPAP